MHIQSLIAYRKGDMVTVLISGNLPRSCDKAEIIDIYPGGNIQYVRDPGRAQVFIEFIPGTEICSTVMIPWLSSVQIPDDIHNEVEVFVNHKPIISTTIFDSISQAKFNKD